MSLCNVDRDNWCTICCWLHFVLYVGDDENEGERVTRTVVKEEYIMRKGDEPEKEDRGLTKNKERG